jgi:AhpD family alkylhydroperoxidase
MAMTNRIEPQVFYKLQPAIREHLAALGAIAEKSGIEKSLIELVKLRASQMNGCAFCLNMHSRDARKFGESQERLDLVSVWHEAPCFSAREQAALAWTEALTAIAEGHVPDHVYTRASAQFSESELACLTAAVIAINGWNRIAVAYRFMPPVKRMAAGG